MTQAHNLALLWTQAQPLVRAFLYAATRNATVADDLMQDVAVTVVDKFAELKSHDRFNAWALAIARHKLMNHRTVSARDRHRYGQGMMESLSAACERLAPQVDQRRAALEHCIDHLDARGRDAIRRRYFHEQPIGRMAEELNATPNVVHVLLNRVRRNLLQCIERRLTDTEGRS